MRKINIQAAFEGMTCYAIERQNGVKRHQPADCSPRQEERGRWIKEILQGMSELTGAGSGKELAEQFDLRLAQAREYSAVELTPIPVQKKMAQSLWLYSLSLERGAYDIRPEMWNVRELAKDIMSYLPWDPYAIGVDSILSQAEYVLMRMTAKQPIRFTRIMLGDERCPYDSAFVSGAVTEAHDVIATDLYEEMVSRHPEVTRWPAVCVVYTCGNQKYHRDASDWDLSLLRMAGVRFLDQPEVQVASGPYEMRISTHQTVTTQNAEGMMTWQTLS